MMVCLAGLSARGQTFALQRQADSLSLLTLQSREGHDVWRLPYPTYAFATGDVDGDGRCDALVGVVKPTRYDRRMARRLFVFHETHGRVRPLWLGSRLSAELYDFTFADGRVITLEQERDSSWFVAAYQWDHFGFVLTDYLQRDAERAKVMTFFEEMKKENRIH